MMKRLQTILACSLFACQSLIGLAWAADADVLVIANAAVPSLDAATVYRLYTGRAIEVAGVAVTVVNVAPGSRLRDRFLDRYLQQDDDKYRAYWTVRRHVGKGVPPREFKTTAEVIDYVQRTPGAIGYVDAGDVKPGVRVVLKP
jgi:ABC-type phosphate transport system substrate-binding protein